MVEHQTSCVQLHCKQNVVLPFDAIAVCNSSGLTNVKTEVEFEKSPGISNKRLLMR